MPKEKKETLESPKRKSWGAGMLNTFLSAFNPEIRKWAEWLAKRIGPNSWLMTDTAQRVVGPLAGFLESMAHDMRPIPGTLLEKAADWLEEVMTALATIEAAKTVAAGGTPPPGSASGLNFGGSPGPTGAPPGAPPPPSKPTPPDPKRFEKLTDDLVKSFIASANQRLARAKNPPMLEAIRKSLDKEFKLLLKTIEQVRYAAKKQYEKAQTEYEAANTKYEADLKAAKEKAEQAAETQRLAKSPEERGVALARLDARARVWREYVSQLEGGWKRFTRDWEQFNQRWDKKLGVMRDRNKVRRAEGKQREIPLLFRIGSAPWRFLFWLLFGLFSPKRPETQREDGPGWWSKFRQFLRTCLQKLRNLFRRRSQRRDERPPVTVINVRPVGRRQLGYTGEPERKQLPGRV